MMKRFLTVTVLMIQGAFSGVGAQETSVGADDSRFFTQKIAPLLTSQCLPCHSHAAGKMEGGLTLDSRSGWVEGGDRGAAVIPGSPENSLVIQAVQRDDPDFQMPPERPLSEDQIELLVEWVARGAPDPRTTEPAHGRPDPTDWWSLRPLTRPDVPSNGRGAVHDHPIDAFVRQQSDARGLVSVPRADRLTLVRRLYFDLHGLPPTPAEAEAFCSDPDPLAWEKLVDRLLDSERYGERWARHWLDTIHFADSHGCEHDVFRPHAWRFRDYVITSLNRDKPWARFIREQLAADYFYPDESGLTPALGFIAAGPLELSRAGTAPVTFVYLDRDDMVMQTMAAFASTTANCARCHDHKFDPITQQDYYALQAVFAGVGKGDVEFDADPAVAAERRRWRSLRDDAVAGRATVLLASEWDKVVNAWEHTAREQQDVWVSLVPASYLSSDGAVLQKLDDSSLRASGPRPDKDTYTITAPVSLSSLSSLSALRLDVLTDESLPMNGPGRQDNGNLHLTEFEAQLFAAENPEPVRLVFRQATADWNQDGWTISHALDGDAATAWGIFPKVGESHSAVFELQEPLPLPAASHLVVVLKQLHGGGHLIGRLKLYATDSAGAEVEILPQAVQQTLAVARETRTEQQQISLAAYVLKRHAETQLAGLPKPQTVYAASDEYSHGKKLEAPMEPAVVHVLDRGDIDKPGEVAVPGALSALNFRPARFQPGDTDQEAARRAALADWLADPDNPLTWRSVVNRVWSYHFGRGLCETPNDFGRMGGVPSHPELLDWLAVWFRDDAQGSLKQLHRLILTSATWQQASRQRVAQEQPLIQGQPLTQGQRAAVAPESAAMPSGVVGSTQVDPQTVDPQTVDRENRWLWRMNRRRLDAESYRDAVLQICGRLDLTMGGPGVRHFSTTQGRQTTPELDYESYDWSHPDAARRSIYRVVWRGIPDPFMDAMDFPDLGLMPSGRGFSVSALQALTLFNNTFVLHHSQHLATTLESEYATAEEQVGQACRLIFLREPRAAEHVMLVEYMQQHGLAATCRVLFNSNEFLFVD
ncbi:MAG: PSD1 and planctomycete cytochrome C domain-containing protein [Fuerstiella sp.]